MFISSLCREYIPFSSLTWRKSFPWLRIFAVRMTWHYEVTCHPISCGSVSQYSVGMIHTWRPFRWLTIAFSFFSRMPVLSLDSSHSWTLLSHVPSNPLTISYSHNSSLPHLFTDLGARQPIYFHKRKNLSIVETLLCDKPMTSPRLYLERQRVLSMDKGARIGSGLTGSLQRKGGDSSSISNLPFCYFEMSVEYIKNDGDFDVSLQTIWKKWRAFYCVRLVESYFDLFKKS